MIAATALVHGLTLVTRNHRDFVRTGAKVIDPFAEKQTAATRLEIVELGARTTTWCRSVGTPHRAYFYRLTQLTPT